MSIHAAVFRRNARACGLTTMRRRSSASMTFVGLTASPSWASSLRMPDAKARPRRRRRGGKPILSEAEGGWTPEAPSAIPFDTGWPVPQAMTKDDIKRCIGEFAAAAKRVDRIGYDVIELHGGHGYLLHQFMSPISNQRADQYGGSTANRIRFPIEVFEAVRKVFPEQ